jgi:UPF0755 protein
MRKIISSIVTLVVILAVGFAAYEAYLKKPPVGSPEETVTIAKDLSTSEIAALLKKAGVISSTSIFTALADISGSWKNLHAGTYIFKQGMSALDALKTLAIKGPNEIAVTIPEGYDLQQIAGRLVEAKIIDSPAAFFAVTGKPGESTKIAAGLVDDYPFLSSKPESVSLEGYMFPDTYRFYANTDPLVVVRRFLDNYKDKVGGLSPVPDHRALTVASLVEAEVRDPADRAKVADIIGRRLFNGMALQLDSTVNYITGKNTPSISLDDRSIKSPWNTYLNKGLPPGPVNNPGLSSIKAALAPTPNPYLYFLTAPEGTVIYSKTLEEHNAAKAKYLK